MLDHAAMVVLSDRPSLVDESSGRRQEHVFTHWPIGDVESVQPVRPVSDPQCAAEAVVELPSDPLTGGKADGRRPSRPRGYGEQGLHSGKDSQPAVGFTELDVDLAQVFLAVIGGESITTTRPELGV
ncbi:hypothetical protein GCM10020367_07250 [Streptomyces sannanensis]|uniref:Uncharacterized protein n=1 Tax=Streptomyces sannanensis TaxID=285536 RepID=A0ABP6S586_9ACTN